ncbi:bifunctional DNA primase/polymerase [Gaertneriomyces semiglobifer]|nr:bifunctional DNA primase/polymerase [Gaertneriomyces semiglobifer]
MSLEGVILDQLKSAKAKLLKKGFVPIPAHPKEKRPLGDWKEYNVSDWNKVLKCLRGVRSNIGVLTGEKSGIVVVDIDKKEPKEDEAPNDDYSAETGLSDWQEMIKEHGDPKTLKCRSPSGGLHYYFRWDDELGQSVATTSTRVMSRADGRLCGIDLRGDGGFIMAPPSSIKTGKYEWLDETEIAPLPTWIRNNILKTCNGLKKARHETKVKNHFINAFANDSITLEDFEVFKTSPYYQDHEVVNVDSYSRIILKETKDFDCTICKRRHVNHKNHPFLVRFGGKLLFVCRPNNGDQKHNVIVKKEEETSNEDDVKDTPHYLLMSELWTIAKRDSLKKYNNWIYRPLENKPCAYVKYLSYQEWVNKVLRKNKIYVSAPKRHLDILKHLEMYNDPDLPFLQRDRNVIAFRNGALLLDTNTFVPYSDATLKGVAARHCIDQDFTKSDYTPMFDQVVMHQLTGYDQEERKNIYNVVIGLIGRLFFDVGQYDKWAVALLLYGESRTGKSTLLNIIKAMFDISEVAILAANTEKIFGLENIIGKELLLVPEIPHNMKDTFDPTMLQSMIDGDFVNVAAKHAKATTGAFKTPIMMAGNVFPNYDDKKGAIVNRVPIFVFENFVTDKDTSIEEVVIKNELPNLIYKSLKIYYILRESHKGQSFWDFAPVYFRDNQEIARKATNWLHRFLTAPAEENASSTASYCVKKKVLPGADRIKVHIEDVKKAFMRYMKFNHPGQKYTWDDNDYSTFKSLGYEVERMHICKSCNNRAKGGKDKCCEEYDSANRTKRTFIYDLLIDRNEKSTSTYKIVPDAEEMTVDLEPTSPPLIKKRSILDGLAGSGAKRSRIRDC